MSPKHSDYRSEEFGFDADEGDLSYRRSSSVGELHEAPGPSNRPSRQSKRPAKSRRAKASHSGMQCRRNKHWNW
ncbi:MAG: hypothetical protein K8T25_19090 [Planctomycetia bacterium]|nr:hypothetical protein [Planctomycetia bacterium]